MKIFEYFYAGKPVIATPIKELKSEIFTDLIYTSNTKKQWQDDIEIILKKPWSNNKKIRQKKLSLDNQWKNKIHTIVKALHE